MTTIRLSTVIYAPLERCFDLSRSIDFHIISTKGTSERAVAGRITGLIEEREWVVWEAVHFGVRQRLETKITSMNRPFYFKDEMTKGIFKSMLHEHHFEENNNGTRMTDVFHYETPFGMLGKIFDAIILKRHMTTFLTKRNTAIKIAAEGERGHDILTATL